MRNLHLIEATYIGPTNARESRVKLHSARFEQSRFIPYDHSESGIYRMAQTWLAEHGFKPLYQAETKKGYALLCDEFKPLKGA